MELSSLQGVTCSWVCLLLQVLLTLDDDLDVVRRDKIPVF